MLLFSGILLVSSAWARPEAPGIFCEQYAESPYCVAGGVSCTQCHDVAGPPGTNPYGVDVAAGIDWDLGFAETLPDALQAVEQEDSDGDGVDNLTEILSGTLPGFDSAIEPECAIQPAYVNPYFELGGYDPAFAFRRVMLDFCGRSPHYEEWVSFTQEEDKDGFLDVQLSLCLQSSYWQEALLEMSHPVVKPIFPVGGEHYADQRLFVFALSGDRDAADLLQAKYYVVEEPIGTGNLVAVDQVADQPLLEADRFGLITHKHSLYGNVMFSAVPRTLAAHYYRELLGLDIAQSQGLYSIDEAAGAYAWDAPHDVDDKGVWQEACAACHSTLDPLSYPWARYEGIAGAQTGAFNPGRSTDIIATTDGYILGQAVSGPEEWVDVAVNSDEFSRQVVTIFWRYVFRRTPYTCEQEEFEQLWVEFRDTGRNADEMLHHLITLDAYGTP